MGKKFTTEQFVEKSIIVHGDLYEYSLVNYVNNRTKVKIVCKDHGIFEQRPKCHLQGAKCSECARINRTENTEKFIEKATAVHGNLYDYSIVEYVRSQSKVEIICKDHGIFKQKPNSHLQGNGCPECSRVKRTANTEKFIEKASTVHGDLYDYSAVDYMNAYTKVEIICKDHGIFKQIPSDHLQGSGCPKCGGNAPLDTESFIKKAVELHGDLYDYSSVEYVRSQSKVKITCKDHGIFTQTPSVHLSGKGCSECAIINRTSNTDEFIRKSVVVHKNLYDYSSAEYVNCKTKVEITCKDHGIFKQIPSDHLKGSGCPKCSRPTGTLLYLIEVEQGLEHFAKVGITTHSADKRFPALSGGITTHFLHDFGKASRETERSILDYLKAVDGLEPAQCLIGNGSTETFKVGLIPDVCKILSEKVLAMCTP